MERALAPLLLIQVALLSPACRRPDTRSEAPAVADAASHEASRDAGPGVYDPRPDHPWNRLYRYFYVRSAPDGKEFSDGLDPLLWYGTRYLLDDPSHNRALGLLDEFVAARGENLIEDPVRRAMLQRDLLAVFDWTANVWDNRAPACQALQQRLARVIRDLALDGTEIAKLPDTYATAVAAMAFAKKYRSDRPEEPFLPPDLFDEASSWVCLRNPYGDPIAPRHHEHFTGRSALLVFMRLPEGRRATLDYLKRLQDYRSASVAQRSDGLDPPQFPAGTAFALVRRAMLIDNQGELVPSPLTETMQIRVYRSMSDQYVYEFKLERTRLFASDPVSLRPLPRDAEEFELFMTHGIDPFEGGFGEESPRPGRVLERCRVCHGSQGLYGVQSLRLDHPFSETIPKDEISTDAYAKRRRYDWGLLQGLWLAEQARPGPAAGPRPASIQ